MALDYFKAISGRFVIKGYQPDGDSVRFIADDATQFGDLHRAYRIVPSKRDGSVQLRLEGMDAPETHYGDAAQPYGNKARDAFLDFLGFADRQYAENGKTVASSTPDFVTGVILTKGADIHGRPISYVLAGADADALQDGHVGALGPSLLEKTLNHRMVAAGQAYALLYSSTPLAHRRILRAAAKAAREARKGMWPQDETELFALLDQDSIGPDGSLIFPKLFRRCTDFLKAVGEAQPGYDLDAWLIDHPKEDDSLYLEPATSAGRVEVPLHTMIEQRNGKLAFQADILDVVFIEK